MLAPVSAQQDVPSVPASSLGRVAVLGATGLLGGALRQTLRAKGAEVIGFSRSERSGAGQWARWNPDAGEIDRDALGGVQVVVNLAGEDLSQGRWTRDRKQRLWDSRIKSTELLASTLAALDTPPRVLVNASAIGFYGDRGDEAVDEASAPGDGFLSELCRAWEAATEPAREAGVRVVLMRYGVILTPSGGALARMLGPFRLGVGGRLGAGTQRFPWIALPDAVGATRFVMTREEIEGPVNVVAPESVTNRQLTDTLGAVLRRPTVLPVPSFALSLAMGEMAREAVLAGANVRPRQLEVSGYRFEFPRLQDALGAMV